MAIRFAGPFNGLVPESSEHAVGFIKDPKKFPHVLYTQFVPAPALLFKFWVFDPDEPTRVENLDERAWPYGDFAPTNPGEGLRGEFVAGRIQRYSFPYTLDDDTREGWQSQNGMDLQKLMDRIQMNKAAVHRTARILGAMQAATWSNTATVAALTGTSAYWDQSSGTETDPTTGTINPSFQIIKKTLDRVMRRVDLSTNGAIGDRDWLFVIPPKVAIAVAESGELVNAVKQSVYANQLVNPETSWRNRKWNLPDEYGGFTWVVEDTVRTTTRRVAAGTPAVIGTDKDYVLTDDTCYAVSRPGGVDGGYGERSFATVQLYTKGGEAQIEAFSEPKHRLIDCRVVLEDCPVVPTTLGAFKLTGVLSPSFAV